MDLASFDTPVLTLDFVKKTMCMVNYFIATQFSQPSTPKKIWRDLPKKVQLTLCGLRFVACKNISKIKILTTYTQVPKPLELRKSIHIYGEMTISFKTELVQLRMEEIEAIGKSFIFSHDKIVLAQPNEEHSVICFKPAGAEKSTCKLKFNLKFTNLREKQITKVA